MINAESENPHLTEAKIDAFVADEAQVALTDADRAMLDYALKLTREPWTLTEADIRRLKEAGFDDGAILDICQVTAYYAFANRLVDGLGVELETIYENSEGNDP